MQYLNGFLSLRKYTGVAKLIDTPESSRNVQISRIA